MVYNFDNPSEAPVLSLVRLEKEPVHVGELDFIVVEEDEFADAATRQHLGRHAAHTPNANHRHAARQKEHKVVSKLEGSFRIRTKSLWLLLVVSKMRVKAFR